MIIEIQGGEEEMVEDGRGDCEHPLILYGIIFENFQRMN